MAVGRIDMAHTSESPSAARYAERRNATRGNGWTCARSAGKPIHMKAEATALDRDGGHVVDHLSGTFRGILTNGCGAYWAAGALRAWPGLSWQYTS